MTNGSCPLGSELHWTLDKSSRVVILRTFLECVSRGNNASLYFPASYGGSRSKRLKEALMHDPSVRKVFSEH